MQEGTELQTVRNSSYKRSLSESEATELHTLRNPSVEKVSVDVQPKVSMSGTKTTLIIGGALFTLVLAITIACIIDSAHVIDEGTVGVYYVYGALQDDISHPGVAWKQPFVSTMEQVTIRPQTDMLDPVMAVTKDGKICQ